MAWAGYGWAARELSVDPQSHQLQIRDGQNPELSASLQAHSPREIAARDAALTLTGTATEYFRDVFNGAHALDAAQDKLRFQDLVKQTLSYPEQAKLTAKYIEKLQDPAVVGDGLEGPLYSSSKNSSRAIPKATFDLNADGQIREICFGNPPLSYKGGGSPYTAICAERDSK